MRHPPKVKIVGSNPAGHAMFIILWGYSMKNFIKLFLPIIALSACNSVHIHPNTLDATQVLYVDAGGRIMTQKFKERMEQRGYKLTVGHKRASIKTTYITSDGAESIISEADIGRARYLVFMQETKNKFRPVWCSLNGFCFNFRQHHRTRIVTLEWTRLRKQFCTEIGQNSGRVREKRNFLIFYLA